MSEGNPYDPDWTPEDDSDGAYFDEPTDEDLDDIERENDEFQENMNELLSHYEAEQDEFNEAEAEFTAKYGFVHKCRCAEDWDAGNLGVVSVCYLNMVNDAMETLASKMEELKDAKRELARIRIAGA